LVFTLFLRALLFYYQDLAIVVVLLL